MSYKLPMTSEQAVEIADASARVRGYNLEDYAVQSVRLDGGKWIVSYFRRVESSKWWFEVFVDPDTGDARIGGWPPEGSDEATYNAPDPATWIPSRGVV